MPDTNQPSKENHLIGGKSIKHHEGCIQAWQGLPELSSLMRLSEHLLAYQVASSCPCALSFQACCRRVLQAAGSCPTCFALHPTCLTSGLVAVPCQSLSAGIAGRTWWRLEALWACDSILSAYCSIEHAHCDCHAWTRHEAVMRLLPGARCWLWIMVYHMKQSQYAWSPSSKISVFFSPLILLKLK